MTNQLSAQAPTATVALQFNPVHRADIEYDIPTAEEAARCTLEPRADRSGWLVRSPNGQILREFIDTNSDRTVDRWCYYKDGIEVYRDIDEDFDKKAEQHRWLNTAGTRHGGSTKIRTAKLTPGKSSRRKKSRLSSSPQSKLKMRNVSVFLY